MTTGIAVLEAVGDLLGVVEALGDHEVDADVAPAVGAHRTQRSGRPRGAVVVVVGEDVVEVVAAAPGRQAADVRALAVGLLELRLGLDRRLVRRVHVAFFGQAEVDQPVVPEVPERHRFTKCTSPQGEVLHLPARGDARVMCTSGCRCARSSPLRRLRRRSPGSCPSTARAGRGRSPARPVRRTSVASPRARRRAAASS